ncbi:MAG: hypothetical protein AAFY39_09385, partial [Pseudomonadota bacterium]
MTKLLGTAVFSAALALGGAAFAFECVRGEASMDKPGGFPERALTMVVPYGPAGGSGQVAANAFECESRASKGQRS